MDEVLQVSPDRGGCQRHTDAAQQRLNQQTALKFVSFLREVGPRAHQRSDDWQGRQNRQRIREDYRWMGEFEYQGGYERKEDAKTSRDPHLDREPPLNRTGCSKAPHGQSPLLKDKL